MQVEIDKKPALKIAGRAFEINNRKDARDIRQRFFEEYEDRCLKDLGAGYGLMEYDALHQIYKYFIGFEISDQDLIDELGFDIKEIAESLYLEIPIDGFDLEEGYSYTYEEFFPNKKYFHNIGPDVEYFQYDDSENEIGNVSLNISLMENPHK